MTIDLEAADKLLTTTRGVRRRIDFDRPVEREVIEDCIEVAMQAPVGAAWLTHFLVVTDPDLRGQVGAHYAAVSDPYLDEMEAKMRADAKGADESAGIDREMGMHRWYNENMHRAPVLVILAMNGRYEAADVAKRAAVYGSNLPVAWSFMLALRARGLGTCWTTLHMYREKEVAELLGIPEDMTQTVLFPVGYYKGTDFKRVKRPPVADYLHWNRWTSR
jgi:nitroreductase